MFRRLPRSPFKILPIALALGLNLVVGPLAPLSVSADHQPRLTISKTPDAGTATLGSALSFTITLTNSGGHAAVANNVSLSDTLPAGFTWTENSAQCSVGGDARTMTCSIGTIAVNASFSVTATSDAATTADCGTHNNTASASYNAGTSTTVTTISDIGAITVPCADVAVAKSTSDADGTVAAGTSFSYYVDVSNAGAASSSVTVSDNLDDDLTGVTATLDVDPNTPGGTVACTVGSGNSVSCPAVTLAASDGNTSQAEPDAARLTVGVTAPAAACPSVQNQATAASTNEGSGTQTNNTSGVVSVNVVCADVHLIKSTSDEDATVAANDTFSYSIRASNDGGAASSVTVTDNLDDDLNGVSATYDVNPGPGGETACLIGTGNSVSCGPFTLTASDGDVTGQEDDTAEVTISVTAPEASCGTVQNQASASASNEQTGHADNSSNQVNVSVVCSPDVAVAKTAVDSSVTAGESAAYTVTVTSGGTGSSTQVALTDDLPSGLTWTVTGDTTGCSLNDDDPNATGLQGDGTLTCNYGTMPSSGAGSTKTVTLTAETSAADCDEEDLAGEISNIATVSSAADTDSTNDSSEPVTIAVNCPDVHIEKDAIRAASIDEGDSFSYEITVTNDGPGAASGVVISDDLDNSLTVTSATYDINPGADGGTGDCTVTSSGLNLNIVTCAVGSLAAFSNPPTNGPDVALVTIEVTTNRASCPSVQNQALVSSTNEPGGHDNDNVSDSDAGPQGEPGNQPVTVNVDCDALVVDKTPDGTQTLAVGGVINATEDATFTITVTNSGAGNARDIVLEDILPSLENPWAIVSHDFLDADAGNDDPDTGDCVISEDGGVQILTCREDRVPPGQGPRSDPNNLRTVTITTETTPADCGTIINLATVVSTTPNDPETLIPGVPDDGSIVIECPDLAVTKVADDSSVSAGEEATYLITVENIGGGDALESALTDLLPEIAGTWELGDGGNEGACVLGLDATTGRQLLRCDFGTLAGTQESGEAVIAGDVVNVELSAATTEDDCGTLGNEASATAANEASDETTQSDNASQASITVECPDEGPPPDDGGTPPTGGELGGRSSPKPTPSGRTSPNTALVPGLPANIEFAALSFLFGGMGMWSLARMVMADRRRRI